MVLTADELIASLQHEVRVFLHLAGKADPAKLDYRPTPGQRSTLEVIRYTSLMGPELARGARAGAFDFDAWRAAEAVAMARSLEEAIAAIAAQHDAYASILGGLTDAECRAEIELFGDKSTRGSFLVNHLLAGCAAYRMQLFLYLKASGRTELNSMNLWSGVDAPNPA